jgi:hypothetical protein
MEERSTSRYAFDLTAEAFLRLLDAIKAIPEHVRHGVFDDAPVRHLRFVHDGGELGRPRVVLGPAEAEAGEARFDAVWKELYGLVRPALIAIGTPGDILGLADSMAPAGVAGPTPRSRRTT